MLLERRELVLVAFFFGFDVFFQRTTGYSSIVPDPERLVLETLVVNFLNEYYDSLTTVLCILPLLFEFRGPQHCLGLTLFVVVRVSKEFGV